VPAGIASTNRVDQPNILSKRIPNGKQVVQLQDRVKGNHYEADQIVIGN